MAELKCPHCGQAFTVDDTELSSIVQQIRDKEFEKDLENRVSELKEHMVKTHKIEMEAKESEIKLKSQEAHEKEIQKLKSQLEKATDKTAKLQAQLDSSEDKKKIAVMEAVQKVEEEKRDLESQLTHEKDKGKLLLEQKDEQIAYYKDLKTKMSTKMVGETLEQHCEIQFNQLRATAFRNAYFEKDNDVKSGSKFVVCIGNEKGEVLERESFPTEAPEKTMENVFKFFDGKEIEALGVGSFGPIDPDLTSPTYGYITTTPKPGWNNYNIMGALKERYDIPMAFDTDVNGAALGEATFGVAKGLDSALYLTIGTGIGGGAVVGGKLVHGLLHPEMGHMKMIVREDDTYSGKCPYHGTCFEGLAAGPAIEARWGVKGSELPEDHPAWDLEAYYIGQAMANYILTLSPKKIILGGGVMHQKQLFPMIHKYTQEFLNGYIQKEEVTTDKIKDYIVYPGLGDNAGVVGALALAMSVVK